MLRRAAGRGEISGEVDLDGAATMLMVLADGMSWRRASDPSFNAEAVLPHVLHMVHCLLVRPHASTAADSKPEANNTEKEGSRS
jgi:TetR/AcrR family transcriptional repressor of uid operon